MGKAASAVLWRGSIDRVRSRLSGAVTGVRGEARSVAGFGGAVACPAGSPNGWRGCRIPLAAVGRSRRAGRLRGRMRAVALRSQPGGTAARVGKPHKEETAGFSAVALWGKRVRPCCGEARSIGRDRAERRCDGPWVRGPVGFRVLRCHCVPDGQSKRPARARDSAGRCRAVAKRGAVERADADGERHAALVGGGARDRGA